ncbi:hypothetical protein K438DRAFT_1933173 [Mycena galopus ATCC 62051]|nr:hypothetical protein K438DRAFT_1933173 [Mycena galopus ATCC 62051]
MLPPVDPLGLGSIIAGIDSLKRWRRSVSRSSPSSTTTTSTSIDRPGPPAVTVLTSIEVGFFRLFLELIPSSKVLVRTPVVHSLTGDERWNAMTDASKSWASGEFVVIASPTHLFYSRPPRVAVIVGVSLTVTFVIGIALLFVLFCRRQRPRYCVDPESIRASPFVRLTTDAGHGHAQNLEKGRCDTREGPEPDSAEGADARNGLEELEVNREISTLRAQVAQLKGQIRDANGAQVLEVEISTLQAQVAQLEGQIRDAEAWTLNDVPPGYTA